MDQKLLKNLPSSTGIIFAGDERIERYSEDTMMRGSPDAVLVARDEKEIAEAIAYCDGLKIPVTICGSQTSMTGASVPTEGLLISTEKLEGLIDVAHEDGEPVAITRPGTVVADLQKAIAAAGFFYPVAPTSRDECRIGSNVVTNATGEDSYKYGPVRHYVKRIELILPNGASRVLERAKNEKPSWERNRAGYFTSWKNPIDLVIGSEGTLGFVSKVWLKLIPKQGDFFSALIPFGSNQDALKFVVDAATKGLGLKPRTLELIDSGALILMRTAEGFPKISEDVKAFLYIKQEFLDANECDGLLEKWYAIVLPYAGQKFADEILIARTRQEKEDFRLWRHRIPEAANEVGREFWPVGGGKIGSDWWVPIPKLNEMMRFFYDTADATKLPYMAYAHVGSGHPHTNMLAKYPEEKTRANDVLIACCKKAVDLGGGVAGEHGIGKIHTDLVPIQHGGEMIEKMMAWKKEYDPNWIFGKGNVFGTRDPRTETRTPEIRKFF